MSSSQSSRPPSFLSQSPPAPTPILKPALKTSRPSTPFNGTGTFPESESISPVFETTGGTDYFPRVATQTSGSGTINLKKRYKSKVGFDTLQTNTDATLFSFTLQMKSEGYKRTRSTRSYLVAASADESGSHALDWVMESLTQDGDELIVFRGFDGEEMDEKEQEDKRQEAQDLMQLVLEKNDENEPGRKLSVIVEFVGGKITSSIERLIALYRPDFLVVGTRTRSVLQQWGAALGAPGMGSVSRYCVSRSPVPVIVVRPEKVRKGMLKRRADPTRSSLFEGLERPHTPTSLQSNKLARPQTVSTTVPRNVGRPQTATGDQAKPTSEPINPLRATMSR